MTCEGEQGGPFDENWFSVRLNVYDVTNTQSDDTNKMVVKINNVTHQLGIGGVFHGGIEVDNQEWSFGYSEQGSGVYPCVPTKNPMYQFRTAVDLGKTPKTKKQIFDIVMRLRKEWVGSSYELLSRNCCHFCDAFARELECKAPPAWLNRFAQGADATIAFTNEAVELARAVGSNVSRSATWLQESVSKMWMGRYDQDCDQTSRSDCMPYPPQSRSTNPDSFTETLFPTLRFQPAQPRRHQHEERDGTEQHHAMLGSGAGPSTQEGCLMSTSAPTPEVMSVGASASCCMDSRRLSSKEVMAQSAAAAAAVKAAAAAAAAAATGSVSQPLLAAADRHLLDS